VLPLFPFPAGCVVCGFVIHGVFLAEVFTEVRIFLWEIDCIYCRGGSVHTPVAGHGSQWSDPDVNPRALHQLLLLPAHLWRLVNG